MNISFDSYFKNLIGKKIVVLGLGVSNRPLVRLLLRYGCDVTGCDRTPREKLDGEVLELTLKEFEILVYLSDNHSRVLTRDQILNAVWGYDFEGDARTVDSHVARLRTKLKEYGSLHIKTVYGIGYKYEK